ncbi:hypothetical protein QP561_01685 [Veillonella nakazawae]|nr:hypothetical protein [Veillonella nakazawae]MDK7738951.1 hypothetical protein [Veillonella nakazawae]
MANTNSFKHVIDTVTPQIEVLQKAIELDPANTIEYQRALDFIETNISTSKSIIKAIKLVEKHAKAEEKTEEAPKPKKETKKKTAEPVKVVEQPKEDEKENLLSMFD